MARGRGVAARVQNHESAGAISMLDHAWTQAHLAEQGGLLVAGDSRDWDFGGEKIWGSFAKHFTGIDNAGQQLFGNLEKLQQFGVPLLRVDVEQKRAAGVGRVGDVKAAGRHFPNTPAIHSAESEAARSRFLAGSGNVVKHPFQLCGGEIRVQDKTGLVLDHAGQAAFLELIAKLRGPPVLPDDGGANRLPGFSIP